MTPVFFEAREYFCATKSVRLLMMGNKRDFIPATPFVSIDNLQSSIKGGSYPIPLLPDQPKIKMVTQTTNIVGFTYTIPKMSSEQGKVYSGAFKLPGDNKGLVLLCHGAFNLNNDDSKNEAFLVVFESLARCLAANGFVVVSMRHLIDGGEAAALNFIHHLKYILTDPDKKFAKFQLAGRPIGLVGVSEGATGAILAAGKIRSGALGNLLDSVPAVVALAPTNDLGGSTESATAVLIMQGTHDGDTPQGAQSMLVYEKIAVGSKFFLWLHGASHVGFLEGLDFAGDFLIFPDSPGDTKLRIDSTTQRFVTKNYVAMFLLWRLSAQNIFKPIFVGDSRVDWVAPTKVIQDDLALRFRGLPLYDTLTSASLGLLPQSLIPTSFFQTFSPIGPNNPLSFKPLNLGHFSCKSHSIPGVVIEWNKAWDPTPPLLRMKCDPKILTLFPVAIEFQAILVQESFLNVPSQQALISVRLQSGTQTSLNVAALIEPTAKLNLKNKADGVNVTRSILSTVRIPLTKFGPLTKDFLSSADLLLDFSGSNPSGHIALTGFRAVFQ